MENIYWEGERKKWPVTIAVRPLPSIPWVTSSAVEDDENPDAPFPLNGHIFLSLSLSLSQFRLQHVINDCISCWYLCTMRVCNMVNITV